MPYTTLLIQGNLISEEILLKIEEGTADGQRAKDFGLEQGDDLRGEIEYAWSRVRLDWRHFSDRANQLPASDPYGTTLARRWMDQFLSSLGFNLTLQKTGLPGDNDKTYAISHTAENRDHLPVHIVGFRDGSDANKNTLDTRSSGGQSRLSAHGTVQEYLNVTEHLYGLVSNGLSLRLIRDSGRLIKLTYVEFDLKRMLDDDKFSEFVLLYRLLHATRFPHSRQSADQCLLEKYYQESIETGNRIRDGLSVAVEESMLALGKGFLVHPANEELRQKLREGKLTTKDYYRQLRRLIYRLLFLMVTEERDLVYDPEDVSPQTSRLKKLYQQHYSIARLRRLSRKRYLFEGQHSDLWKGLVHTFMLFEANGKGVKLGIKPLGGDLFSSRAIQELEPCDISNSLLLECIRNLNEFHDDQKQLVAINYRSLDVEELGSVYEGLLELHPIITGLESASPDQIGFTFHAGTDRKTTGSYYTRPDLVNELIKSALIPVIEERLKEASTAEARENALLGLKVCDPAAGSGHMLLAAARTIAWYVARVSSGDDNPPPGVYSAALREVIMHCIYAVDYNPDALELCKLALWLEGHNSGKPLGFLDHKIRNGNSLVGVTDLSILQKGIPTEAYSAVTGDDKDVCKELKKANAKLVKVKQFTMDFAQGSSAATVFHSQTMTEMDGLAQDSIESVQKAQGIYERYRSDAKWLTDWRACNIWTAAFFFTYQKEGEQYRPTSERLYHFRQQPGSAHGQLIGMCDALSMENRFFHWPLEFPDVFEHGGFDVMLGNPPWEIVELKEQEFFATRDARVAHAEKKSERSRLISELKQSNPSLYQEYLEECHRYEATRKFISSSGRFPLTAVGRINMYAIFSELFSTLIRDNGRAGFIVQTGIATDDGNKHFFTSLVDDQRLVSLFDFENREKIFSSVDSRMKFCLLTISGRDSRVEQSRFGFFLTRVEHIQDDMRVFELTSEDFELLNPNTRTCPVFRTRVDAELTKKIYRHVPVLINERTGENPWGVSFKQGLFNMSTDSHLFRTREQLESEGYSLWGNKMKKGESVWLPLYEGKMCHFFNHRASKVYFNRDNAKRPVQQVDTSIEELKDPAFVSIPAYFVPQSEVLELQNQTSHFFCFKSVTSPTNERTFIGTVVPYSGVGNSLPLIKFSDYGATLPQRICLYGVLSSLTLDYVAKQKVGGVNLNFFYVEQLPIPAPSVFDESIQVRLVPKLFELFYTSWDLVDFAKELLSQSSNLVQEAIQAHLEQFNYETQYLVPEWLDLNNQVLKTPRPFLFDVERRQLLKAELEVEFAKIYGLDKHDISYLLDPTDRFGLEFPGQTFEGLQNNEISEIGEYRTKRLVMEAWGRLESNSI